MSTFLALDIGRKHTGVAFCDQAINVPLPLDTIHHENDKELLKSVSEVISEREIETLIAGLPLLSNGEEGEEAAHVRGVAEDLTEIHTKLTVEYLDERHTSQSPDSESDPHAHAALELLRVYLERQR